MVFRTAGFTLIDDMRTITLNPALQIPSQIARKENSYKTIIDRLTDQVLNID